MTTAVVDTLARPVAPVVAAGNRWPRLLVATHYAPDTRHGGAFCVQRLLEGYPEDRLAWLHHDCLAMDPDSPCSRLRQWSIGLARRPNRFGLGGVKEFINWTMHAPRVADEAVALARGFGVDAVLGIGPGIGIWTSHLIAERLNVPLHLWVHDDPVAYAQYRGWPWYVQSRVRKCFLRAYAAAARRYVISEPMREHYLRTTGHDAVLLPPLPGRCDPSRPTRRDGRLRIGLAGSIAGDEVWEAFLRALRSAFADAAEDAQPEIHVFSEPQGLPVPEAVRECGWVRVHGWQPSAVVARELRSMDYLYLPLWFREDRRLHVATSFSTKFVSYLQAGVPILCHVPAYSAVAEFVRRYPVGPLLDTMDESRLAAAIRDAVRSPGARARHEMAIEHAAMLFDGDVLRERFHENIRRAGN